VHLVVVCLFVNPLLFVILCFFVCTLLFVFFLRSVFSLCYFPFFGISLLASIMARSLPVATGLVTETQYLG
jgi:hypothetical protein